MGANDEKKKSLLAHVTNILFRPKSESQEAPASKPETDPKKIAEAEEKRQKMLDAYAKHCESSKSD